VLAAGFAAVVEGGAIRSNRSCIPMQRVPVPARPAIAAVAEKWSHAARDGCPVGTEPLSQDARRLGVGPVGGSSRNWPGLPSQAATGTHDVLTECNGMNELYWVVINFSDLVKRWKAQNHWAGAWCAARDSNPEPAD
jgi:hypothetical protein